MADYDFTACLSPLDFELLSKDLLEAELGIQLENFSEGRDGGIDLRYSPIRGTGPTVFSASALKVPADSSLKCNRVMTRVQLLHKYFVRRLESVRQAYAEFAERFVEDCDSDNPDEIRSDAARIGHVGEILGVDTDTKQTTLRDFASEIESENEKPWDDDDDRHWGGNAEECLDRELDSMFGTLKDQG